MVGRKFPFHYPLSLLCSYTYVIAHCEQQLRLLQLIEENPGSAIEAQEHCDEAVFSLQWKRNNTVMRRFFFKITNANSF